MLDYPGAEAPTGPRRVTVSEALEQAHEFAKLMSAEFPDLAEDEEAFLGTLEGETDVLEVVDRLVRRHLARKRLADAARQEKADIEARIARLTRQADGAKALALTLLQAAGTPDRKGKIRLERASYTASVGLAGGGVEVTDASMVPASCLRHVAPEPDKAALKAMLEAMEATLADAEARGAEDEAAEVRANLAAIGARLVPARPSLTVRTR